MELFFKINPERRRVVVVPWTMCLDKVLFIVSRGVDPDGSKYRGFDLGTTPPEIFAGLVDLGFKVVIDDVYQALVVEDPERIVVWTRVGYSVSLPPGIRYVTSKNLKRLVKGTFKGLESGLVNLLTRGPPNSAHTRLGGILKGIKTYAKMA